MLYLVKKIQFPKISLLIIAVISSIINFAIIFGDLNDPSSEIAKRARAAATTQLRADLRTDNGVRYQGL